MRNPEGPEKQWKSCASTFVPYSSQYQRATSPHGDPEIKIANISLHT
jgi:hypothetical protein